MAQVLHRAAPVESSLRRHESRDDDVCMHARNRQGEVLAAEFVRPREPAAARLP